MALLFPDIHPKIDWSKGYEFLDKELQQIGSEADNGRCHADKLAKVHTREGDETWVLIHVEVQGERETTFAARMYTYHFRLLDRYGVDVVSLAVLADTSDTFRPNGYQRRRWGCEVDFRFPIAKLLDLGRRWEELEVSDNVFALVVMAQLKAKEVRDGQERKRWKLYLIRLMYERGYARADILSLFRIMDWMLRLPKGLEREFWTQLHEIEEDRNMPYVTSVERIGREEGLKQGLEQVRLETARNMIQETPLDDVTIARVTGLAEAEISALREELKH